MTTAERAARRLDRDDRDTLAVGPWCWPVDEQAIRARAPDFACARDTLGVAPFLTVSVEGVVSLFLVMVEGRRPHDRRLVAIESASFEAARRASGALELLVPRPPVGIVQNAMFLDHLDLRGGGSPAARVIEGGSFGLAAMLALVSRALHTPPPPDAIAIAAVDDVGGVRPVDDGGLRDKVRALARLAPRIRRVIVAEGQQDSAGVAGHEVLAASRIEEAIDHAWSATLPPSRTGIGGLVARLPTAAAGRLADEITRNAVFGKGTTPMHYEGVVAVADWLQARDDLEAKRGLLQIAAAIARRHTKNGGAFTMPTELRSPEREELLAQWLQQCADAGGDPDDVDSFAAELRPGERPASVGIAKAHGALARWWAVSGAQREAVDLALTTARHFIETQEPAAATHSLSLALQFAGVVGDRDRFDQARRLWLEIEHDVDGVGAVGAAFVRLAEARGALLFEPAALASYRASLEPLWRRDQPLPWHVSTAAGRLLARASAADRDDVRAALETWTFDGDDLKPWIARVTLQLIRLDDALASGDHPDAEDALRTLAELDAGVMSNLRRGPTHGHAFAAWIARAYPY